MWVVFALQKLLIFLQQKYKKISMYIFENTTVEFFVNELIKLMVQQLDSDILYYPVL